MKTTNTTLKINIKMLKKPEKTQIFEISWVLGALMNEIFSKVLELNLSRII